MSEKSIQTNEAAAAQLHAFVQARYAQGGDASLILQAFRGLYSFSSKVDAMKKKFVEKYCTKTLDWVSIKSASYIYLKSKPPQETGKPVKKAATPVKKKAPVTKLTHISSNLEAAKLLGEYVHREYPEGGLASAINSDFITMYDLGVAVDKFNRAFVRKYCANILQWSSGWIYPCQEIKQSLPSSAKKMAKLSTNQNETYKTTNSKQNILNNATKKIISDEIQDQGEIETYIDQTSRLNTKPANDIIQFNGSAQGSFMNHFYKSGRSIRETDGTVQLDACALLSKNAAQSVEEVALLGNLIPRFGTESMATLKGDDYSDAVYLNTHFPFCLLNIGVQGAGKSHSTAVVMENCLIPMPIAGMIKLHEPMTTLVFHYDLSPTNICESTGLITPSSAAQQLIDMMSKSLAQPLPPPHLDRSRLVVLVSPSFYKQRQAFYKGYCEVRPLLFSWKTLTAKQLKILMRINEGDTQLYVSTMLDLLRRYQRENVVPKFDEFMAHIENAAGLSAGQAGPLRQRRALLESIVAESALNESLRACNEDVSSLIKKGVVIVADLTDPLLAPDEANSIFQVLLSQFRKKDIGGSGKLLVLDEAHKYMDGQSKSDGLSASIVDTVRLMRHEGMRVVCLLLYTY